MKEYRKIRNDHTFSYGNKFYLIKSPLKYSIAKQKIEIRINYDNSSFTAYFCGKPLAVSEVVEPTKPSMHDLEIQKKIEKPRIFIFYLKIFSYQCHNFISNILKNSFLCYNLCNLDFY